MHTIRKFEDVPYRTLNMPWHGEKLSVKILLDEFLGLGMRNSTLMCLRLEPGGYTKPHEHTYEQAYFFLSGEALLEIGGEEHKVGPYATVLIPPGTVHSQKVIGDEPVVLLEFSVPPIRRSFFTDKNIWPDLE